MGPLSAPPRRLTPRHAARYGHAMRTPSRLALCALLVAGRVSAQNNPTTASERAGVRRSARAGDDAFAQGDYEGALQLFQSAFRADPRPRLRRNLAECYEALQRPLEAVYHLERYLDEARGMSASEEAEIRARIGSLRANLATLRVRVTPNDALDLTVTVDGLTIPPDGVTQVRGGAHSVQAAAEGFRSAAASVVATAGVTHEVSLTLVPIELGPRQAPAPAPASPPPSQGLSPTPFFVALGATAACTLVWAAAGSLALDARGEYDAAQRALLTGAAPDALPRRAAALSRAERLAVLSDLALGVSIAGAVVTAVLATRTDFRSPPVELDVMALPQGGALSLRGRF